MTPFYFLIAVASLLAFILLFRKRKHPKYPPGPLGLPLIGNIHQMGLKPYLALRKWKVKYGDIFSVKLGLDDAVVINNPKLVRELFSDPASSGRFQNHVSKAIGGGNYGIINIEGREWEEQRRFVLRKLRDLGFAKSSTEGMIQEEAKSVVNWFWKNKGTPISCERVFNAAVVNTLWGIVSGERTEWGDENGNESEIMMASGELIRTMQHANKTGLFFVSFLRHICPNLSGWTKLMGAATGFQRLCEQTISRHQAKLNPDCPQDLIDHFLIEIGKTKDADSSFADDIGMKNLKAVVLELFGAGNETTSATLSWTMLYLSCHPVAQKKLIDEIRRVVGTGRLPSLTDKPNLPYTEAVISEVLRKSSLAPIGLPHRMLEDKMFHGYFLPKHVMIIGNIDSAHNDPEYWDDPEVFRPERFLSEDGTKVMHNEALIAFSAGKRQCLGESFARDTIFLFITSVFQRFGIGPDPQHPAPNMEPNTGILNLPKPFHIVLHELD